MSPVRQHAEPQQAFTLGQHSPPQQICPIAQQFSWQQTSPGVHTAPFGPQGAGVLVLVLVCVLVGVLEDVLVLVGVLELVGVGEFVLTAVLVGVVVGTQVPFWHSCPTSSQEWQTWSEPQTWQASPQSATVQHPPG
jgi:hypothetical protein